MYVHIIKKSKTHLLAPHPLTEYSRGVVRKGTREQVRKEVDEVSPGKNTENQQGPGFCSQSEWEAIEEI